MTRGSAALAVLALAALGLWLGVAFSGTPETRPEAAYDTAARSPEPARSGAAPEPGATRPASTPRTAPLEPSAAPPAQLADEEPAPRHGPAAFAAVRGPLPGPTRAGDDPSLAHARRSRHVRETPALRSVLQHPDAARRVLSFDLFDDLALQVVFDHVERRNPMGSSLVASGRVLGMADSDVVAVIEGESLAANLLLPTGELYQVRSVGGGQLLVKEVDRQSLGDCVVEDHHHLSALEAAAMAGADAAPGEMAAADFPAGGGDGSGGAVAASYDPATTIDVLVVYSAAALSYAGGTAAMQSLIDLNIATINRIYAESGAVQQLRLVGSAQVDYAERGGDAMGLALEDVTDGVVPGVRSLRDQLGADLVTFVVRPSPYAGTAGIAWVPSVASMAYSSYIGYSAIAVQAFDDPTVLAHELGHNQGNNHDAETIVRYGGSTASAAARTRPWAFGYIEPQDRFHTVMAYGSSCGWCLRLGRFSNPDLRYDGRNTGSSSADARRVLNETVAPVSQFRVAQMAFQQPEMVAPDSGAPLPPGPVRFAWDDRGATADAWWLQIGSEPGGVDLYDSGALSAATRSVDVSGLPLDGRTLHVRLWYQSDGDWLYRDGHYDAAAVDAASLITGPAPGSLLDGSDVTISWSELPGVADEWQIHVGTSFGGNDLFDSGVLGSSGSLTISGLPTDGSTLYVRVFYRMTGAAWSDLDFTYTAATIVADPELISPAADSTLTGPSQTFSWAQLDGLIDEWWFYLGSSPGGRDIHDSGSLGASTSVTVNGIPTDGRALYARVWFRRGSGPWLYVDATFTAATLVAELTSPAPGSTLGGPSASFSWSSGGHDQFWLYVGSSQGGSDLHDSGALGASLSTTVGGLPQDGRTLHVRLWYRSGATAWGYRDATLTAHTAAGGGGGGGGASPMITSPAAGSPLAPGATLSWSDPGGSVQQWWVYLGTSQGARNLMDSGNLGGATSTTVGSLGSAGTVHVRLWYRTSATGAWSYVDSSYAAAVPDFVSPAPGATLGGATETFTWSNGGGTADGWWLYLGTTRGARNLLDSGNLGASTSLTVSGLPTDGRTLHARLWFRTGAQAWSYLDRTFRAAP